ncbi:MAG: high-affinity branched-chain amino acid ABC transporter permease LivM [Bauldia sp.]
MAVESIATDTAPAARLPAALRNALLWAGLTVLMLGPVAGLGTLASGGTYVFQHRWGLVAVLAVVVFAIRLAAGLLAGRPNPVGQAVRQRLTPRLTAAAPAVGPVFIALAVLFPFLAAALGGGLVGGRYWIDLGVYVLTFTLLGWGLNIVVGLAGLLDLGYVAFYAVGAYSFALLAQNFELSFWICLPIAGMLAALWGVLLGFPVLRLRGDYLAIVTLAFGEIIRLVLINWRDLTGGARGIIGIPRPSFLGFDFMEEEGPTSFSEFFGLEYSPVYRLIFFYYVTLGLALIVLWVTQRLRRLPIGRAWEALREDEIACRALGISVVNTKLAAFAIGAMFGGFAGTVFAARQGYINPGDFTFLQSALVLAIVVLGGLGSTIGIVLAAIVLIGGVEMLRNLGFLTAILGPTFEPAQYRMLIFGMVMVAIMVLRPRGLVSTRKPSILLGRRPADGAPR